MARVATGECIIGNTKPHIAKKGVFSLKRSLEISNSIILLVSPHSRGPLKSLQNEPFQTTPLFGAISTAKKVEETTLNDAMQVNCILLRILSVSKTNTCRERKRARTFLHKLFEHPQESGTSRQKSRDIPDSSLRNPRKANFRGRARSFRPPPLRVEDPHPTGRSPDPKSLALCSFLLPERVSSCFERR